MDHLPLGNTTGPFPLSFALPISGHTVYSGKVETTVSS